MTSQIFFFIFIPILATILLGVNILLAPHNPYEEKNSVFECGFHSFLGQNRSEFSISFFIFALLFLLFDLEILLVYPYIVSSYVNGILGLIIMLIFFLVLTLGFVFELGKNALSIDSRQVSNTEKYYNTTNSLDKRNTQTLNPLNNKHFVIGAKFVRKASFSTSTNLSIQNKFSFKLLCLWEWCKTMFIRSIFVASLGYVGKYGVYHYTSVNVFIYYINPVSLFYFLFLSSLVTLFYKKPRKFSKFLTETCITFSIGLLFRFIVNTYKDVFIEYITSTCYICRFIFTLFACIFPVVIALTDLLPNISLKNLSVKYIFSVLIEIFENFYLDKMTSGVYPVDKSRYLLDNSDSDNSKGKKVMILNMDNSSNSDSSDNKSGTPSLQESKARGKWDSSTVPDTVSDSAENEENRLHAGMFHRYHEKIESSIKDLHDDKNLVIKTNQGNYILDLSAENQDKMEEALSKASNKNEAQAIYDEINKSINTAYANALETSKLDKESELRGLRTQGVKGHTSDESYSEEYEKIVKKYDDLDNDSLAYANKAKAALNFTAQGSKYDLSLLGKDENYTESDQDSNDEDNKSSVESDS